MTRFEITIKKTQSGFTIIELVSTMVIIAVLSAFTVPRVTTLKDEAALSTIKYTATSLQQGVQIVRQQFRVKGYTTRVQNLPGFGDGNIDTNNIGYPIGITKGNGNENIGVGNNGCIGVWNGILQDPATVSATNNNSDYRSYRHTSNKMCSYVYLLNGETGNRTTAQFVIEYDSRDGQVRVCGQSDEVPNC